MIEVFKDCVGANSPNFPPSLGLTNPSGHGVRSPGLCTYIPIISSCVIFLNIRFDCCDSLIRVRTLKDPVFAMPSLFKRMDPTSQTGYKTPNVIRNASRVRLDPEAFISLQLPYIILSRDTPKVRDMKRLTDIKKWDRNSVQALFPNTPVERSSLRVKVKRSSPLLSGDGRSAGLCRFAVCARRLVPERQFSC